MKIVGAGMAGLIAAHNFRGAHIVEKQSGLPDNHNALLRFRTDNISNITKIPFKKVTVRKAIVHNNVFADFPNPYLANQYSLKVTGELIDRSIWNVETETRYIAPADFVKQLGDGPHIDYNTDWEPHNISEPVISTIPMPVLMRKLEWPDIPKFSSKPIWALSAQLEGFSSNVCQTIYFTSLEVPQYRASLIGQSLIIECIDNPASTEDSLVAMAQEVLEFFGIPTGLAEITNLVLKEQKFGKIVPIDDELRKDFMYTATRDFNIYSLGRFATWKQILLDDLVQDMEIIKSLVSNEGKRKLYHQQLASIHKNS